MIRRSHLSFRSRRRSRTTRALALLAALLVVLPSCQVSPSGLPPRPRATLTPPPAAAAVRTEPEVRVRVVANTPRVTLAATSPITIGPFDARLAAHARDFDPPVTVTRANDRFVVADRSGQALAWNLPALRIQTASGGDQPITVNGVAYPATVVVHPAQSGATVAMDVINHVPIERYLPGVIERELYPNWAPEAFVAQAIAARSYAIAHQAASRDRHFDLESTTASQVYGGEAKNPRAIDAVQRTRGQVLVYNGRIVPAFYSSSSGGVGQNAVVAFPDVKLDVNMPPLQGRTHGWGRSSTSYNWGPFSRDVNDLSRRIAAWGRASGHGVANLGTIRAIGVAQRSATGRPAAFRIQDHRGQSFLLAAEQFRFACNHLSGGGGGLPALDRAALLKSSHVDVSVRGGSVLFANGRGYGHGVGLDQWAAQEMAQAGYTGQAIVTFFYPGASVQRVY